MALEHFRSARPSQPPALYLLATIILDTSRIRTLALVRPRLTAAIIPLAVSLAIRVTLFTSLQLSTRSSIINGQTLPPAATAGLVQRYLVTWVLPVLWRGYRSPLKMSSLGAIDTELHSLSTWEAFEPQWRRQQVRMSSGATKSPLLWACARAFAGILAAPILPLIIYSVVGLAKPLIVGETVTFAQSYSTSYPKQLAEGWGLVGASFLVYTVYALALALAEVAMQRGSLALRGALMEAIYRKSLLIKAEEARTMGAAKASNLMSVDVKNVITSVRAAHNFWTAILMTGLGMYVIYTQIGLSFVSDCNGFRIARLTTHRWPRSLAQFSSSPRYPC